MLSRLRKYVSIHFLPRYDKDSVIYVDQDSVRSSCDYVRPRNGFLIEYYNNIIVGEMTSGDLRHQCDGDEGLYLTFSHYKTVYIENM